MAEKKKKFNISYKYFFFFFFAQVAFFLMDVIGGFNNPGYDWISKVVADLTALDSYSLVLSLIFSIIYAILIVVSGVCIWKFIKKLNFNKLLNRGIKLFIVASMILALGTTIFLQPQSGTYQKIKDDAVIVTKDQPVEDADGNLTETQEVIDMDATIESFSNLAEPLSNPLMIGNLASVVVALVLSVIAFIFSIIGGFKKKGNILFGAFAIFCCVMVLYTIFAFLFGESSLIGLNTRFALYAIVLFTAFMSSYIYITYIEE